MGRQWTKHTNTRPGNNGCGHDSNRYGSSDCLIYKRATATGRHRFDRA